MQRKIKISFDLYLYEYKIVYKCMVHARGGPEVYIEQTANSYKNRYRNYVAIFKTINTRCSTSLADIVWRQNEDTMKYSITSSIVRQAKAYKMPSLLREIPVYSMG